MSDVFSSLLWGVLSLMFGSFANVCVHRIPRGESIVTPRSRCPHCLTPIRWHENIPVLSYLFLRGRCSHCRGPISVRYPLTELSTLVLLLAVYMNHSHDLPLLAVSASFTLILIIIFLIDLEHQVIPDVLSLILLVLGCLYSPWNSFLGDETAGRVISAALGFLTGSILMMSVAFIGKKIWHKEALGGGDIKLMSALGPLLGWKGVLLTLAGGSIVGTVLCVVLLWLRKIRREDAIPFGPFLTVAAWLLWMNPRWLSVF